MHLHGTVAGLWLVGVGSFLVAVPRLFHAARPQLGLGWESMAARVERLRFAAETVGLVLVAVGSVVLAAVELGPLWFVLGVVAAALLGVWLVAATKLRQLWLTRAEETRDYGANSSIASPAERREVALANATWRTCLRGVFVQTPPWPPALASDAAQIRRARSLISGASARKRSPINRSSTTPPEFYARGHDPSHYLSTHPSPGSTVPRVFGRVEESAGINRHGVGDENALHRRSSESRCPRVMRWRSVRAQRSVDRGRAGGAIEPRNTNSVQGADVLSNIGRQYCWQRFRELLVDPARSENPGTYDELHAREPGDPVIARLVLMMPRPGWFAGWQIDAWRAARGTLRR